MFSKYSDLFVVVGCWERCMSPVLRMPIDATLKKLLIPYDTSRNFYIVKNPDSKLEGEVAGVVSGDWEKVKHQYINLELNAGEKFAIIGRRFEYNNDYWDPAYVYPVFDPPIEPIDLLTKVTHSDSWIPSDDAAEILEIETELGDGWIFGGDNNARYWYIDLPQAVKNIYLRCEIWDTGSNAFWIGVDNSAKADSEVSCYLMDSRTYEFGKATRLYGSYSQLISKGHYPSDVHTAHLLICGSKSWAAFANGRIYWNACSTNIEDIGGQFDRIILVMRSGYKNHFGGVIRLAYSTW